MMKFQYKLKVSSTFLIVIFLAMIISPATALIVHEENYQKVQDSFVLIEQLNGTEMTSAEFMETVWPEIYEKISLEHQRKLSEIPHSWNLTKGDTSSGGLRLTSNMDSPEHLQERYALMHALSGVDITHLQYMAIVMTEYYLDMPENIRKSLAGEGYSSSHYPSNSTIQEGQTQWYSTNVSANVTLLTSRLSWENPPDAENNLSITIYSPDHAVFGPFTRAVPFADTQKMLLETTISREKGVAEGEWWYCVRGVNVNGSQTYTL